MHKATPEELAISYVTGDLTDTQLNYWIKTRNLDSQEIENLIEWYRVSMIRYAAAIILCFFLMLPIIFIAIMTMIELF